MSVSSSEVSIRILMLHGYAQSGGCFEIKTKPLTRRLTKTLSGHYNTREDNIQLVFPDAPLRLGRCGAIDGEADITDSGIYGWTPLYGTSEAVQYQELERSLSLLSFISEIQGPFSGVVGFSQGAALAAIFASWCETDFTLGRRQALQDMGTNLDPALSRLLSMPPQKPLDFAILCSGFRANMEFYHGFYHPPLSTPSIHVLGELDTMIPKSSSLELLESCQGAMLVEHQGVHFVPRDTMVVEKIMQSLLMLLWFKSPLPSPRYDCTYGPGTRVLLQPFDRFITATLPPHNCSSTLDCASATCSPTGSENSSNVSRSSSRGSRRPRIVRRYRLSSSYRTC
ncbi:serine hydrolase-domain-containing protein [Exophiala viscosa]|uniref:Serine hydrolase-domain-containing protein n=1 Tax=Exophiala viscosa TaxID=2486360 RepID=A0AAN6E816_9EURO|nr:serine hydrolase-domain-containing protein [Exophiala viscosa]